MAGTNARTEFFVPPFEVRFVWPNIAKKRTVDFQGKPLKPEDQYYDVTMFIPKTAASPWACKNYMYLADKLGEVIRAQSGWGSQWPGALSSSGPCRWPIADCDLSQPLPAAQRGGTPVPLNVAPDFLEKYPWARGHWRVTATANYAPRVVDQGNNDVPKGLDGEFTAFKGGDWGQVSMNAYAYVTGTGGISFGFEGIKKTREDQQVGGGGRSVEAMFGAPTGQPASPYGAPPAHAPPPPVAAPQIDPTAGWQRSPDGVWVLNPQTNAWEAARPTQPAPPPAPAAPTGHSAPPTPISGQAAPAPAPYGTAYPGSVTLPSSGAPPAPPPGNPVAPPAYGAPPSPGYPQPPAFGTR